MLLHEWIKQATSELVGAGIGTAKLDAELILSHTLKKPRTWIHMYRDEPLAERRREIADARLQLRLERVPLAYIIGHKEFYGRRFTVTPATLIPRPESEALIDLLKELHPAGQAARLIDVGTGSGCLGITAKLELPDLDATLSDSSKYALKIAVKNAAIYSADVTTLQSDLLSAYPLSPDIIMANLPYVDTTWERSPETDHEPAEALFAPDKGLRLIDRLVKQAGATMRSSGLVLLEADPVQHEHIIQHATEAGFQLITTRDYCVALRKV